MKDIEVKVVSSVINTFGQYNTKLTGGSILTDNGDGLGVIATGKSNTFYITTVAQLKVGHAIKINLNNYNIKVVETKMKDSATGTWAVEDYVDEETGEITKEVIIFKLKHLYPKL